MSWRAASDEMLILQLKGKRHPVSVYEVVPLAMAAQLRGGQQPPAEGALGSRGMARGPASLHGPAADLQTPLIGAAATMSKVRRAAMPANGSHHGGEARRSWTAAPLPPRTIQQSTEVSGWLTWKMEQGRRTY